MKTLLIIFLLLVSAFVIYLYYLGIKSQSGHAPGLVNGKLTRCPVTPNCVNSEYREEEKHYINPITFSIENTSTTSPLNRLKEIILQLGGKIQHEEKNYISATFTSTLFRFVDDLEVRLDNKNHLIHLRSASRVGHSDMGVNKKRVNKIIAMFEKRL